MLRSAFLPGTELWEERFSVTMMCLEVWVSTALNTFVETEIDMDLTWGK